MMDGTYGTCNYVVIYQVIMRNFKASMVPFWGLKINDNKSSILRMYPVNTLQVACHLLCQVLWAKLHI